MNKSIFLTIGIPTYNREISLRELIVQLSKFQPTASCEILIINNGPPFDYAELQELIQDNGYSFKFIQNSNNCGGQENVLRVYENASGEYVWFLGDDDRLFDKSLDRIITTLRSNPCDCLLFDAKAPDHPLIELRTGYVSFNELFSGVIPLRKFMFAPLNVVRTSSISQQLARTRLYLGCFTPQLLLILNGKVDKYFYLNEILIHCDDVPLERNQRLSILPVFKGIGNLPLAIEDKEKRLRVQKLLKSEWRRFNNPITVLGALAISKINGKAIDIRQYISAGNRNYPFLLAIFFPALLLIINITPKAILSGVIEFAANKIRKKSVNTEAYFSEDRV